MPVGHIIIEQYCNVFQCRRSLIPCSCPQNFPLLKRLKTLLVSNNLIFRIGDDLKESLPNVHTIMLANNSLLNLSDLKPFASLPTLRRLCLIDNNVTKQVCSSPSFSLPLILKFNLRGAASFAERV